MTAPDRLAEAASDLLDGMAAIVWEADAAMRFRSVSPQAERVLGYPPARWLEDPGFWHEIILPDDREAAMMFHLSEAAGDCRDIEYRACAADGRVVWIHERLMQVRGENGQPAGLHGLMLDVTSFRQKGGARSASLDELTGLPNRSLLHDRLRQAMAQAERDGELVAVLCIDLDRFKIINDSLGHNVGDNVLQTAAGRLIGCLREVDTVARTGGDEFVALLPGLGRTEDIVPVAQKLLETLAAPFVVGGQELFLTASIGISTYPRDGMDVPTLRKNADIALYRAKEGGRNRFEFFTGEMNAAAVRRLQLESKLRQALARDEFVLHYHPQAEIVTGRIVGVEALVRWQHPELGLVSPAEFIPLAEETGLIVPLGEWVLENACRQAAAWHARGLANLRMAVNLSVRQVIQGDLIATVRRILRATGLPPALLKFELTESLFAQDGNKVAEVLGALRTLGIRLSVDDFGTGYSSLSYLHRFPVTSVKIDQSFVRGITSDPAAAALVRSIIGLAHDMGLHVIAEGVETEGQLGFLAHHRCDEIQGYYLSRPLPARVCESYIRSFDGLAREAADQTPERILLLVDDEPNITTALKRLLRGDGYRILTAGSGREGLELLAMHEVGVIVSDQRMPEMTGVDFLRRVKDIHPDTVRIVLSGYTELKSVTDAINEGAIYKFLTKPWDDEQLREHVREAFQRYELKRENVRLSRQIAQANRELAEINRELERRVAEKTEQVRHNMSVLQVSQEILEHLPAAVIGIDDDGLVVVANRQADRLLAGGGHGSLIGFEARECLPPALLQCLAEAPYAARVVTLADGRLLNAICHDMGEGGEVRGTILVCTPVAG